MKRSTLALIAVATLTAGVAQPALAAKAPKPLTQTFFLHGVGSSGNEDVLVNDEILTMDTKKPTGGTDKDYMFYGAATSPNRNCAGGGLMPSWVGAASGTLTGKMTVNFYARSTPGATTVVQIFSDVEGSLCNADKPTPVAEVIVPLKAGASSALHTVEIPIPAKSKMKKSFMIQFAPGQTGPTNGPQISGIGYDSTVSPSAVTFTCIPSSGKKTC